MTVPTWGEFRLSEGVVTPMAEYSPYVPSGLVTRTTQTSPAASVEPSIVIFCVQVVAQVGAALTTVGGGTMLPAASSQMSVTVSIASKLVPVSVTTWPEEAGIEDGVAE